MDIVYVTYQSEKWIRQCFASLFRCQYDLKQLHVYVVDNASSDATLSLLEETALQAQQLLGSFTVLPQSKNLGFGKANNLGFAAGSSPIVAFLNIDTELLPNSLTELDRAIAASPEQAAVWEMRQFPYEHPKDYNPLTMETGWCSGAAFAARRTVFAQVGGFDERIFLYAEDVDLSWRIRSFGYRLLYVPQAVIYHYSYSSANQIKPTQYLNEVVNNLLLRYRFGTARDVRRGHVQVIWDIFLAHPFPHSRSMLLKAYLKGLRLVPHFTDRKMVGTSPDFSPYFRQFEYSVTREGSFYANTFPGQMPLVSVLVRTCGRPAVLREALLSLRHQTYPNLEVVVVEDGENLSEEMIRQEFPDLKLLYHATGTKVGRSKAGNLAMELAHGSLLNFLDDDDVLYPEHLEVLVSQILATQCGAAYAFGFETPIETLSRDPYRYRLLDYRSVHTQAFDKLALCHHNYIPIQCILFRKELFTQYGGLDETLDALEDWDLWVRYSMHTDFCCVPKTTSQYRVPADSQVSQERQKALDEALETVRIKHRGYRHENITAAELAQFYSVQDSQSLRENLRTSLLSRLRALRRR